MRNLPFPTNKVFMSLTRLSGTNTFKRISPTKRRTTEYWLVAASQHQNSVPPRMSGSNTPATDPVNHYDCYQSCLPRATTDHWSWRRSVMELRERDRGEDSKWYSHFLGPAWLSSPAAGGFHILGKLHMLLHTWSGRKVVAEHSHIRHTVGLHSRLGPIGCQSLPGTANGRWTWINPKTVNTLSLHLFMKRIFPAKVIFNLKYDFTEIYMYIFLQCAPSLFRQVGGKTKLTIMDFLHLQYSKLRLA